MARARIKLPSLIACGVLGVAGCGGGDDKTSSSRPAKVTLTNQPTPKRPLKQEIVPFAKAVATQDCKAFTRLVSAFTRGVAPGTPAKGRECKGSNNSVRYLRTTNGVDRTAQFGTGGVMDGPILKAGRYYTIWTVDSDGRFRYSGVSGTTRQAGTRFTKSKEAARVAARYVDSIRKRDCTAMGRLFSPRGTRIVVNAGGNLRAACDAVLKGHYLAPAVRKTANPRIEVLGGTRNIAFVGLATKDIYFTMVLGDPATRDLRVFDALPSTPIEAPPG